MDAITRIEQSDAVRRLWARDASLFSDDPDVQAQVAPWLGWLGLGESAGPLLGRIAALTADVAADDIGDVVLLGMGGSSLAALVAGNVLPAPDGAPTLTVLDTSSPATILSTMERLQPTRTLFVVASKSGGTIEPNSLYAVFRAWMDETLGREAAGRHFIATTDPGTSLENLALAEGFRDVVHGPVDVGGRYSALTAFGLLPAALIGRDVGLLAERAAAEESTCRKPIAGNPGAFLAAWMADALAAGRDKLTVVTSRGLDSFGLWVEQLVAESTGKEGTGIVPVLEREPVLTAGYGSDRVVAVVRWQDDQRLADWAEAVGCEMPVFETALADPYDLGAEFVRWEIATGLAGYLLGVNPFTQPSVTAAKEATGRLLDETLAPPAWSFSTSSARFAYANVEAPDPTESLSDALAPLLASLEQGDYLALLAYIPEDAGSLDSLFASVNHISQATGNAGVVQLGPRYLHSTGQLHKGGPNTGVFLVVTTATQPEVTVPGRDFTLGQLYAAQALGDLATLSANGRRVVAVELEEATPESVAALGRALESAL